MQNYTDIGLDNNLRRQKLKNEYISTLNEDTRVEKTRLINNIVTKGTVQTTDGGLAELNSVTGGTILFTVDPQTGEVTITGPVIANVTVNFGSMNNSAITGTSSLMGTLTSTGIISGGTINNATFGTPNVTGGTLTSVAFVSGTIPAPRITNVPVFDTSAGSAALGVNGGFAVQFHSGSAILVTRHSGTTFYFTSAGVL